MLHEKYCTIVKGLFIKSHLSVKHPSLIRPQFGDQSFQ